MSLSERITQLADRPLSMPAASRLDSDRADFDLIVAAHQVAMDEGLNGYLDPMSGAWVFTAAAHAARGFCCENGCRHCPFTK